MKKICEVCEREFETLSQGGRRKYCFICQPNMSREDKNHSSSGLKRAMKKEAIRRKGGKCEICGYDKCSEALDFHHLNPENKEFDLSIHCNKSWTDFWNEAQKCQMLCANCHRELHAINIVV